MAVVSVEKVAQAMNITPRRVQQLVDEGMPRQAHGAYDLGQCMAWYIRYLQEALERRDPAHLDNITAALRTERQRLTKAQADLAESELAQRQRSLVPIAMCEEAMVSMIASARARLLALPGRVAGELENCDRQVIKTKLQKAVYETLLALSKGPRRRRPAAAAPAQRANGHEADVEAATRW